jgi:SAM-dependent methyltransferase
MRLRSRLVAEGWLTVRGLLLWGTRYRCPCCGWGVRAFADGGTTLRTRATASCPRCNAKARHRRIWLFLRDRTDLFTAPLRLFEISPKYAFSRRFVRMPNLTFVGADKGRLPNIALRMDLRRTPLADSAFDAAICVHVLEHIDDDAAAMAELHRIVRPGGWALVSVPTDMDDVTIEDPSITDKAERKRRFGEEGHVRRYGHDIVKRLEAAGFDVEVDLAADLDPAVVARHGLRLDENLFWCRKASA